MALGCGVEERPEPAKRHESAVFHPTRDDLKRGTILPGSYIVSFRTEIRGSDTSAASFLHESNAHSQALETKLFGDARIQDTRFLTTVNMSPSSRGPSPIGPLAPPLSRLTGTDSIPPSMGAIMQVDFKTPADARAVLEEWESSGALWYAEPNGLSSLSDFNSPNFESLGQQYRTQKEWWIEQIGLPQAFDVMSRIDWSSGSASTDRRPIIAVLDSGVDYEHPALRDQIWTNERRGTAGCDDDLHGCDTTQAGRGRLGKGTVWPYDLNGPGLTCIGKDRNCSHGTHVAGIIAANSSWTPPGGDRPPLGVCPICRIMILKVVSKVGNQSGILDSSILAALKYISLFRKRDGAQVRVINASFGKFSRSRSVSMLVRDLRDQGGTLVVGAAGNEDSTRQEYPAALRDAIAVAAVDERLRKLSFSNFGSWVDISAPGESITSTVPGQRVDSKSGTSMAAPIVSGVAGLLVARSPQISFAEMRDSLINTADPSLYTRTFDEQGLNERFYYPSVNRSGDRQPLLGLGLLNAEAALNGKQSNRLPYPSQGNRVRRSCGTTMMRTTHVRPLASRNLEPALLMFLSLGPALAHLSLRKSSRETSKRP